jgi:hypothetical protein
MARKRNRFRLITLGIAAALLGVSFVMADSILYFSHELHLEEQDDCMYCHMGWAADQLRPDELFCAQCHEEPMMGAKLNARARKMKIPFPHATHVRSMQCRLCHENVESDDIQDGAPTLRPTDCFSCHKAKGVHTPESKCTKCHGENERFREPEDHAELWKQRHGEESKWRVFDEHGKDCRLCHGNDECVTCHRRERPLDHNGLWRLRLHGKDAAWDRDRCKVCHESGWCVRCHRNTRPLNHVGAWALLHERALNGAGASSCYVCHSPAWCNQCHNR